jgi:membrane fusion protein, multidrug efflux system
VNDSILPKINLKNFSLFFLLLFCFSACGKEHTESVKVEKEPATVTTLIVEAKDIPVSFEYVAQTQSSHLVNIQARVSGFLDKRVYTEGEMVKQGQVLFLMDEKPFKTQVDAAQAALERQQAAWENARLNLARVKPLAEQDALSQKDLDDALGSFQTTGASVEQAKAQLETDLLNLSYCTITSPLDGITSAALQQEGSYLNLSDSQLTTVSALSPIWVNFSLSENQFQNFRDQVDNGKLLRPENDEFIVKVIQVNGKIFPYTGNITFTEPYFNAQTGTFLIRASVNNPEGILRPNQYVRVKVEGAVRPNAILIPQRAVQQSAKGQFVWIVNKENKADYRPVTVGDWQGENWFISEGLLSGEQLVLDGGAALHAGDSVKVSF